MGILDINTTTACEHIGEIERGIFWLKERMLCVVKTLCAAGVRCLHKQIVIHMVYYVIIFTNAVSATLGVQYLPLGAPG